MRVLRAEPHTNQGVPFLLLDDADQPISIVSAFLRYLSSRDCSPNTLRSYIYDLLHFMTFLQELHLSYEEFTPAKSLIFLDYLRHLPSRRRVPRANGKQGEAENQRGQLLSASTINRIFATISSFYEYLIVSEQFTQRENPIQVVEDHAAARVPDRHRPFMGPASHQRPMRRIVHLKTAQRLPRPMREEQVTALVNSLTCERDRAMFWLMVQGGLRPGEVLNLHLEDIQYGRRRVIVRYRTNHPRGVRTKSRRERIVDLREPEALQVLNRYVMYERPHEAETSLVFLVGGKGARQCEPLSYHALVKLFARHCQRLGIREPWVTPHALRHTHATRMWEGGMRELSLQKRLGHASPESTRLYTQVSDETVIMEYRQAIGEEPRS